MNEREKEIYSEVLVDVDARRVNQSFHYAVPAIFYDKLRVGSMVLVSFGNRRVTGYVTGIGPAPVNVLEKVKIKEIEDILEEGPVFTSEQLELARWISEYTLCTVIAALQAIISPRLHGRGPKKMRGLFTVPGMNESSWERKTAKRLLVWQFALKHPGLTRKDLSVAAGVSVAVVDKMVDMGLLFYGEVPVRRNPYPIESIPIQKFTLTPEQTVALDAIKIAVDQRRRKVFLLFGVTGSGKTQVYIQSIAYALAKGKQALVMVPEIALTPQMVSEFKKVFGDQVAVLHSRLSDGERYDEWIRIAEGSAQVVLGTRSAAFAPVSNLGLIIMDEEHEPSYKQEETPRYHARDVVLKLIGQFEAVAVLGSATPSLESYHRAQPGGPYQLLTMLNRVEMRPMPNVRVIDMQEEQKSGNPGILSMPLVSAIEERLERREQVILFLNRRGYATLVVCRECGLVMKCSHCDISLTYHTAGHLCCHYCNSVFPGGHCPDCGSSLVEHFGAGTQKLEEEIRKYFPGVSVSRMDSDTTSRKGSHARILKNFKEGEAQILIGTQMVAKGLDIPAVTLVGVVNADTSLHMPDFRAAERTFQLVAQVAGRAGRGNQGGEVLVQTLTPKHYSIIFASRHDYVNFYHCEIKGRKMMNYPPFSRLARILVFGKNQDKVKEWAERWALTMKEKSQLPEYKGLIEVLGPAPAQVARIKDRYRYHIVIKSGSGKMLKEIVQSTIEGNQIKSSKDSGFVVDIDPYNLM